MKIKTNENSMSFLENETYKKITNDIRLTAILNKVYAIKMSSEMVNTKVKNQLNAINFSISQINPKFNYKSKNYGKVSNEILNTVSSYEKALNQLCNFYDERLEQLIFDKVEIESKILFKVMLQNFTEEVKPSIKKRIVKKVNSAIDKIKGKIKKNEVLDVSLINKLKDEQDIAKEIGKAPNFDQNITILKNELEAVNEKIQTLNEEKGIKVINALESKEKGLSTDLKKPRTFKKIKKFFANRFNTYNVIIKTVIQPINERIENLQENKFQEIEQKEIELIDFENKIKEIQENVIKNAIDYLQKT